ncbi:MlaC/ttg2D family ABC transporter substrate-binding protein [Echinimonas agarilytica]|uniref:ABC transporter substrate-binding protein n=1 Tax=Echinimonas agarilytica TaxID=1215918 RepID=A0AA41W4I7_9GAMM|nr:ABC transporter substrate-binding protein [Echinimonas agarilytica]MCM2678621.1 ABC transporter substrate-binding protein [Echinimonas agarilytica]
MHLVRLLSVVILSILSVFAVAEVNTKDPSAMLQQVATETLDKISKMEGSPADNPDALKTIVVNDLLPHVDYVWASYKVIGPAIRETSKEQRAAFADAFKNYMVGTFTLLFKQYDPARHVIQFDQVRIPGQIPARFVEAGKPDITLIFYVRENKKTGDWKVWDLAAQGISQVETKHKEFKPLIRQHGLDYVTTELNAKVNKGLAEEELSGFQND